MHAGLGGGSGPIGWETFEPEGILWLYKYYGNVQIIAESYNYTKVRFLHSEDEH